MALIASDIMWRWRGEFGMTFLSLGTKYHENRGRGGKGGVKEVENHLLEVGLGCEVERK